MPFDFQGYQQIGANQQLMAQRQQEMERNAMLLEAAKRAQASRGPAMQMMYDSMGGQQQGVPPPPPPQPAPQPGAMSPGGGNPMAQGGASVMAPPVPQQQMPSPLKISPFRAMPGAPAAEGGPQPMGGQVPPPPQAAPQQPQAPAGKQFDLKTIIGNLKNAGVPPEKAMDMLDTLTPVMSAENKRELELHKTENAALRAATQAYTATINAMARDRDSQTRVDAEARRREQGDARNALLRAKIEGAAQGGANLKSSELVYPKGPDGKADMTKEPLGIRGITKSGKIINLDHEGHPVATLGGVTGKESNSNTVRVSDTVRKNLVEGGAKNALARLDEIEKNFPNATTSALISSHAEGLTDSLIQGGYRSMQTEQQQKVDAAWSSFIDEAIPVFTGGLRGSDAFRRFLISQVPTLGTKTGAISEKRRLLRANIEGMRDQFTGAAKPGADTAFAMRAISEYANNPKYWGTRASDGKPVTKADIDAMLASVSGGGGAKRIAGDEEFDALPSGAHFIGPDGQERVKP